MKNYIKLLPAIMVIFNYGYSSQLVQSVQSVPVQQPVVVDNNGNTQVNSTIQQGVPQNIEQSQNSNFIKTIHGSIGTSGVNSMQINTTTPQTPQASSNTQGSVQSHRNSMPSLPNNNMQPVQSNEQINNMQYVKSKTITPRSDSAKMLNDLSQLHTVQINNSTSVPTVNQQPQKLYKANTIQNNAVIQNNQNVAPIKKTNSLGAIINSSQALGQIQSINRNAAINNEKHTSAEKLISDKQAAEIAKQAEEENAAKIREWQQEQLITIRGLQEKGAVNTDSINQTNMYYNNILSQNNGNGSITLSEEQKLTLNKIYKILALNIQELKKSFPNILKSKTNNNVINILETFNKEVIYKTANTNSNVLTSYQIMIIGSTAMNNTYPASLIKTLSEAISHKNNGKNKDKEKYTIFLLTELLKWFSKLPYANTQNDQLAQTSFNDFISKIDDYFKSLPFLFVVK